MSDKNNNFLSSLLLMARQKKKLASSTGKCECHYGLVPRTIRHKMQILPNKYARKSVNQKKSKNFLRKNDLMNK
jgi:hypothetical protein